jgi:hypothetical protein
MPIRFQVDGDFYDHPKSIGLSDAATALWVRAGSYSANKLTDGLIAEHVLATLSRTPEEAAEELVRRGLWRRVRGGYRFHQWDHRNLTKARVEADRTTDRKRKRLARQTSGETRKPQASPPIVQLDGGPDSGGNPDGIQDLSVSVSVSGSVSGSGRPPDALTASPPPPRCPDHLNDPDPPRCGRCADARKAREAWDQAQLRADAERRSAEARAHAETSRLAIAACHTCDDRGYLPSGRQCTHDPNRTASNGAAVARAAIRRPPTQEPR